MSDLRNRMPLIDAFKAVASQMIVLHHLAFYGPMSDWMHQVAPGLVSWFSQDARMAVQVFLVISGFLAVRGLAPQGVLLATQPLALLGKRYANIAMPYVVSLLVAMVCTWLASQWMDHTSLPGEPEFTQFLAHALLLHSVMGIDSLSAGVWYVAIDFQLFALMLALLWLGQRLGAAGKAGGAGGAGWSAGSVVARSLVLVVGVASLYFFNRDAGWDNWALYFFGAYTLGALAWWMSQRPVRGWQVAAVLALVLAALAVDFRERIALALAVALVLGVAQHRGWLYNWPDSPVLAYLGRISYGVFLMNFPVSLVVNAAFTRFAPPNVWVQSAGVLLAWVACVGAGALFFHTVEQPLRRWSARPQSLQRPRVLVGVWLLLATILTAWE